MKYFLRFNLSVKIAVSLLEFNFTYHIASAYNFTT